MELITNVESETGQILFWRWLFNTRKAYTHKRLCFCKSSINKCVRPNKSACMELKSKTNIASTVFLLWTKFRPHLQQKRTSLSIEECCPLFLSIIYYLGSKLILKGIELASRLRLRVANRKYCWDTIGCIFKLYQKSILVIVCWLKCQRAATPTKSKQRRRLLEWGWIDWWASVCVCRAHCAIFL